MELHGEARRTVTYCEMYDTSTVMIDLDEEAPVAVADEDVTRIMARSPRMRIHVSQTIEDHATSSMQIVTSIVD